MSGTVTAVPTQGADGKGAAVERFWDRLMPLVEEGRVIPILGQDLLTIDEGEGSRPLMGWLVSKLAQGLGIADVGDVRSLHGLTCRYLEDGGELDDVYVKLRQLLRTNQIAPPTPLLQLA